MRAFLALPLPPELEASLVERIGSLKARAPNARFVGAGNLHVTVRFLGDVADGQLGLLDDAIRTAVKGAPTLELKALGSGTFGKPARPRVLHVGFEGDLSSLSALEAAVSRAIEPLGFAPESRPFAPHLTLARARAPQGDGDLAKLRKALDGAAFGAFRASELVLFQSELSPTGARHSALKRYPLGA